MKRLMSLVIGLAMLAGAVGCASAAAHTLDDPSAPASPTKVAVAVPVISPTPFPTPFPTPLPGPTETLDPLGRAGDWGGTLTTAITAEPAVIDPQAAPNPGLKAILPYLFDTLVVRDPAGQLVPSLAASWQIAPNDRTVTFKLRPDVWFLDGSPLDARAVQTTFQRFKKTGTASPIYKNIQTITAIDVVDGSTVRFTVNGSAAALMNALSIPYAGILSVDSANALNAHQTHSAIGTGPMMLDDWTAGQSITLRRNQGYHWGSAVFQNHDNIFIERVVFQIMPDSNAQVAALQAGQLDAIYVDRADEWAKLQKDPSVRLVQLQKTAGSAPPTYIASQGLAVRTGIDGIKIGGEGEMLLDDAQITGQNGSHP